jgi:hypothetical protein
MREENVQGTASIYRQAVDCKPLCFQPGVHACLQCCLFGCVHELIQCARVGRSDPELTVVKLQVRRSWLQMYDMFYWGGDQGGYVSF